MNFRKYTIIVVVVALAIGFGGGLWYADLNGKSVPLVQNLINQDSGKPQNVDFSMFWTVWNDVTSKYYGKADINQQDMVYGAIQGMVNSLGDPYTVFFPPDQAKQFNEEISGAFGGVGLEVDSKNNVLTVVAPIKDSPAAKAGIQTGDQIIQIDGTPTAGQSVDQSVASIRGKVGTKVTLTITDTSGQTKDVTLTRDTINVPTVEWKMIDQNGKHIAYIQAYEFNENIDSQFKTAADEILKSDAQGIILDLRGNPGGLLDSAINLAGYMLPKNQLVVSERFTDGTPENDYSTSGDSSLQKYPTVVLVDGGSASAAEILSGALHDDRHIQLVGDKTFGKGSVQELENLDNGASLKITVAHWYTPGGININKTGIEPDISVPLTDQQKKDFVDGDPAHDPQLQKALDVMTK